MSHRVCGEGARRSCVTVLAAMAMPAMLAFAQEQPEAPLFRSLEPVREYVKDLDRTGQLRKMTLDQVIEGMFARDVVGQDPERVKAARLYATKLVRSLQMGGKLQDGERQPVSAAELEANSGPLGVSGSGIVEVEPNDSPAQAQPLVCGDFTCSSLATGADADWYTVTLGAGQWQITCDTTGASGDTLIGVFTGGGTLVGQNDDFNGSLFSHCIVPCLGAGPFFIEVISADGNPVASYSLTVTACLATTDQVEVEPNAPFASRNVMAGGPIPAPGSHRVCGFFGANNTDTDYWEFSLASDSIVTIVNGPEVDFGDVDTQIRLFTTGAATIYREANQFAPGGTHATMGLKAGTYVDRVSSKFGNNPQANYFALVSAVPATADDELEPNGTAATANPIACNQTKNCIFLDDGSAATANRDAPVSGDFDYYTFTIPAGPSQEVTLLTAGGGDSLIVLYDNALTEIARNQDISATDLDSEVDITLAPGTYFVRVTGPNPNTGVAGVDPWVPYTLSLMCAQVNESEPNNTSATANAGLNCPGSVTGRIGATPDNDYWSFTLPGEAAVTVTLATGGNNATVAILASDGTTVIASGTNGTVGTIDAGSYFIRVSDQGTGAFAYTLMTTCAATPVPVDVEPNDNVGSANATAGCGDNKVGLLSPRDSDVDYWSFTLSQWSLVTATVTVPDNRSSVDPFLEIVDPFGNPVRLNDDFQGGPNSQVLINLPPGTWYAAVRSSTTALDPDPRPDKDLYELHIVSCTASVCSTSQPLLTDNGQSTLGAIVPVVGQLRPMGCLTFKTTDASTAVDVTVSSATIEPSVILTDGSNNYIDYDDDDGDGESANICDTLPAGIYFLRVQNLTQQTGNLTVTVRFTTRSTAGDVEPNDVPSLANPLANFGKVSGRLLGQGDVDYYSFDVTDPTNPASQLSRGVTLTARTCIGHDNSPQQATNVALAIYDANPSLVLAQDVDNGPDADEILTTTLAPGHYYVAVSTTAPVDPKEGRYELELRIADVAIDLTPAHGPTLNCSSSVTFNAQLQNLAGRAFSADFDLFLQVGNSPNVVILTRRRNVGLSTAHPSLTRPMSTWLARAGIPCPGSPAHARFSLVSYLVDRTNGNRLAEQARAFYDFTLNP